ncbi:hypothetical protein CCUS01_11800 [Colletotrichum cuscutae]|uniref:Uncharacterized protein n=1 Tax=Colletotrichum cuscutae TaxID=1209917 RepID=A0AAI9U285_9PEZI|nr:hypothetical protein CCUS01_11800 [Colletotrichum cuscutae]
MPAYATAPQESRLTQLHYTPVVTGLSFFATLQNFQMENVELDSTFTIYVTRLLIVAKTKIRWLRETFEKKPAHRRNDLRACLRGVPVRYVA